MVRIYPAIYMYTKSGNLCVGKIYANYVESKKKQTQNTTQLLIKPQKSE